MCYFSKTTHFFFFKIYFYYYYFFFIGKADIQRGETERKIFRLMIHSPNEHNGQYYADPKPGASSGSPTRVQGPKALGCPRMLSWATGRELEGKQGCRDRTGTHMGSRVCKARSLTTAPPRRALDLLFERQNYQRGGETERQRSSIQ